MRRLRHSVRESVDRPTAQNTATRHNPQQSANNRSPYQPNEGLNARQRALISMQRTQGNAAVLRMLSKHRPGVAVQRTVGDGHDLTSSRFAGDETLEAAFDDEKEIKSGDSGDSVRKIQKALIDSDHPLPQFGADGKFGKETEEALKSFQEDALLPNDKQDGVVRSQTMLRFDQIFPTDGKKAGPPPDKTDFQVLGKQENSAKFPNRLFFDLGKSDLDSEEQGKIADLAKPTDQQLTLFGYASEEGGVSVNAPLINQRIGAVEKALGDEGHEQGKMTPKPAVNRGEGRIDYRFMRSVEVVGPNQESTTPDCKGKGQDADCKDVFDKSQKEAYRLIEQTKKALGAKDLADSTKAALKRVGVSEAKIPELIMNFDKIKGQVDIMTDHHQCHNLCDPTCAGGSKAYNNDAGKKSMMTLCPSFLEDPSLTFRAEVLIHEASHGTEGLETGDLAYGYERVMNFLSEEEAMKNGDTYRLLVGLIDDPSAPDAIDLAAPVEDKMVGMDATEKETMRHVMAFTEKAVHTGSMDTASLYSRIVKSQNAGRWIGGPYEYQMSIFAPRFGLTSPPGTPNQQDRQAMSAIHDRYHTMANTMKKTQITVTKDPAGKDAWAAGPGTSVTVSQGFFNLPDINAKTNFMIKLLVEATPNISPELVPKYVECAGLVRDHLGQVTPK